MGHLGRLLGIPMTDSFIQTEPDVKLYYQALQQEPTNPPVAYVDKLTAESAVDKYKPEVVIASWLTHKWIDGASQGSVYGPDEAHIVDRANYIHIGNDNVHKSKTINALPHDTLRYEWLVSRAMDQSLNNISMWSHNTP